MDTEEEKNGSATPRKEANVVQAEEGTDMPTRLEEENDTHLADDIEEVNRDADVAPALIAVHPSHEFVAVAVGSDLRVFDLSKGCPVSLANDSKEHLHKDSIRAVRFSEKGTFLVSAGDDKVVKLWSTQTWQCLESLNSEKRVSAVAISKDEKYVCFADKFGVVWVVDIDGFESQSLINRQPVAILAHYCSIIPSLEFSPDGKFLISADRDFKIRVTVFPKKPINGAHEIQSFCLGHSEFVSCLALVHNSDHPEGFLLSGSGDSTVCMWDILSGSLLFKCEVGTEAGVPKQAVTDLCAVADGSLVAAAIQSLQGILLLTCNLSSKTLSVVQVVSITGETFIPTSLGASSSADLLWMVTGVSNLPGFNSLPLARVRALSGVQKNDTPYQNRLRVLGDHEIPCGEKLLLKLQGRASMEDSILQAASEAIRSAMTKLLIKKQYTDERREFRKRGRNDRKIKR